MSRVGVSITKSVSFRGVAQEFSNTYYYETPLPVIASVADSLIDNIVAKEKAIHSVVVSFLFARCWSAGGTKQENNMITQKSLSGTGSGVSPQSGQDRERAFLVRARAGVDTRGNPVYLRKWWHLEVGSFSGANVPAAALENTGQLTSASRTTLENAFDGFKTITALPQVFDLVSEKGRAITGATQAHPYLEHRQLGDQWRG
jgi:hypothetical protein